MRVCSFLLALCAVFCMVLSGCSGGGGSDPAPGTVSVGLTDATTSEYKAVYVSIKEVQVHRDGGGWLTISEPNKTVNLLELVNGAREELALASLEAGHYTQLRLVLMNDHDGGINILSQMHQYPNYFIAHDDGITELKTPSALQSGLKIVKGFDISPNQTTELILDFDVSKSIVMAGSSGNWILKPTIKMLKAVEWAIVSGQVEDAEGNPLTGALVSAQVYNTGAEDPKDIVTVETSTITEEGGYRLFLAPGRYNLVCYKDGFAPAVQIIEVTSGSLPVANFELESAQTGSLTGNVLVAETGQDLYATLSIRQELTIDGSDILIEIKSLNILNNSDYTTALNAGNYFAACSSYGLETRLAQPSISAGNSTVLDFDFTAPDDV